MLKCAILDYIDVIMKDENIQLKSANKGRQIQNCTQHPQGFKKLTF